MKGYYTYDASSLFKGQLLPGDENTKTNEQPIYLLEGKHSDDNNKENPYLLTLGVNGTELKVTCQIFHSCREIHMWW